MFRLKLLWKYSEKNMVKRISPKYSRPLPLTAGLNLRILKALKNGAFRFTLLIRIHLGKEHRTSVTTGCSADIPKGVSIENYTDEQILWFADEMNDMPRRQLGYSTPAELFEEFLDQVYSVIKDQVA